MGEPFGGGIAGVAGLFAVSAIGAVSAWIFEGLAADPPVGEGPTPLQSAALLIGVMILVLTVVRIGLKRRPTHSSGEPSPPRNAFTFGSSRGEARARPSGQPAAELESILVELQETGREIEARLDTKIRYALRLLKESEEALAKLEMARARVTDTAERITKGEPPERVVPVSVPHPVPHAVPVAVTPPPPEQKITIVEASDSASMELPAKLIPETQVPTPKPAPAPPPKAAPSGPEQRSHDRIRELAHKGRDPNQIAAEVGRPIGEVQLILALGREDDAGAVESEDSP